MNNEMLVGSNELQRSSYGEDLHAKEEIKKTPFKYRFIDWIKANLFAALITAVVLGVGSVVVSHMVKIAVIEQRIEYIEDKIETIEDDSVDKDFLESQLALIKAELSGGNDLSMNDVNWKIKQLEERITSIEGKDK